MKSNCKYIVGINLIDMIIIVIKKISLLSDFYNPAAGFLPVTWGNRKVF